eukprot:2359520-Prymnesium_polylepis.1
MLVARPCTLLPMRHATCHRAATQASRHWWASGSMQRHRRPAPNCALDQAALRGTPRRMHS